MKKKILLLSLSEKIGSKIGRALANNLGLYFLSVDEYIEYSLFDTNEMLIRCGESYYLQQEKKALQECLDFENTIYFCSYEVFINNQNLFSTFQIFYIYLSKEQLEKEEGGNAFINKLAFSDRDQYLSKIANKVEDEKNCYMDKLMQIIRQGK